MKKFMLAAIAALTLGAGSAYAMQPQGTTHQTLPGYQSSYVYGTTGSAAGDGGGN
jgi:hypothetical protein